MTMTADNTLSFSVDDVEQGGSKGFHASNGQSVFAVNKDGQLYVYLNRCPHLGIELEWQEDRFLDSEGMMIQCATHGALFVIENGECVAGPCAGEALTALPFVIDDSGQVSVCLDQPG